MTFKQKVLSALSRDELMQLGQGWHLAVSKKMSAEALLLVVARSPKTPLSSILSHFTGPLLVRVCKRLEIPSSKTKQTMIDRILHAEKPAAGLKAELPDPPAPAVPAHGAEAMGDDEPESIPAVASSQSMTVDTIRVAVRQREIDLDASVVALQLDDSVDAEAALLLILPKLFFFGSVQKPSAPWVAFVAINRPHVEGLGLWIGFSQSMPVDLVNQISDVLEQSYDRVGREIGQVGRHGFVPFLYGDESGIEAVLDERLPVDPESLLAMTLSFARVTV